MAPRNFLPLAELFFKRKKVRRGVTQKMRKMRRVASAKRKLRHKGGGKRAQQLPDWNKMLRAHAYSPCV